MILFLGGCIVQSALTLSFDPVAKGVTNVDEI